MARGVEYGGGLRRVERGMTRGALTSYFSPTRLGNGECTLVRPHPSFIHTSINTIIRWLLTNSRAHPYSSPKMSTIASPRPSSSVRSPSSTRTSFETSARPPTSTRRNRAALRDYYGLKATKENEAKISEESARTETELGPEDDETLTELDASNFDADAYVNSLLAREGLQGVLRVEADLVSRMCAHASTYLHIIC